MVPHVAESPRRVDKTAVLRFSAHGLRIDYSKLPSRIELQFQQCLLCKLSELKRALFRHRRQ